MFVEPQICALKGIPHIKYEKNPNDNASFFYFFQNIGPNLPQILSQEYNPFYFSWFPMNYVRVSN